MACNKTFLEVKPELNSLGKEIDVEPTLFNMSRVLSIWRQKNAVYVTFGQKREDQFVSRYKTEEKAQEVYDFMFSKLHM
jgi:hypothetical protein